MKLLLELSVTIIMVALMAFGVIFYVTWTNDTKTLDAQIKDRLEELAFHTMDKIDHRISFVRMGDLRAIATDPIITSRDSTPRQITDRLIEFRNIYKTYISMSFFDLNRIRIADTAGLDLGERDDIHRKYWDQVLQGKLSIARDMGLSKVLGLPVIYFASPVVDKNGQPFGAVVTRVSVDKLYDMVSEISQMPQTEKDIRVDLVDRDGLLIYSNYNRKGILKDKYIDWEHIKDLPEKALGTIREHRTLGEEESFLIFCRERGYLDFKGNGWTLVIHVPIRVIFEPLIELRNRWLSVALPVIIVAIIVSMILSFRLSGPLTKLRNAAAEIGRGRLSTRVNIKSHDEIGDLGNYFNRMAEDLEHTTTSIEKLNVEIAGRKKVQNDLQETYDRLEKTRNKLIQAEKEAALGRFSLGISHEVKNPLSVILGGTEFLEAKLVSCDDEIKKSVEVIKKSALRANKILEGILQYVRPSALRIERVRLSDLVDEIVPLFKLYPSTGKANVTTELSPEDVCVNIDRNQIYQVIFNIVKNAIEASLEGGTVVIKTGVVGSTAIVTVIDNGTGISKNDLPKIFEPFFTTKRPGKGIGLGLVVVKSIIDNHKGELIIESEEGKGTTVKIILQLA